jgi:long-chain acyl-CoA synthetase
MFSLRHLEALGHAPAVHDDAAGWVAHAELARRADEAVAALPARSLVALVFTPTLEAVAVYLGALRHGHVPVLFDEGMAPALRDRLLAPFGVRWLFEQGRWTSRPNTGHAPALHPDLALLMGTSGSTGMPKLVRLSHGALQANAEAIVRALALGPQDRAITSLPLHYAYGLSVLNSHFVAGAAVVLSALPPTRQDFWATMRRHQVTGLAGVPTTWRTLLRLGLQDIELPDLRHTSQAGGRLDVDEVRHLLGLAQARGWRHHSMYGQTEATARIAVLPPDRAAAKPGCIGVAVPGTELLLRDPQGGLVQQHGVEAELVCRGPHLMMGYATEAAHLAGGPGLSELRTGDLAWRDADGDYWISGRLGRFLKLQGRRTSLDDVEQLLRQQGLEAAALGEDEQLRIVVEEPTRPADALRREVASLLRVHASLVAVRTVAALPRTPAGKTNQVELQRLWESPTKELAS